MAGWHHSKNSTLEFVALVNSNTVYTVWNLKQEREQVKDKGSWRKVKRGEEEDFSLLPSFQDWFCTPLLICGLEI